MKGREQAVITSLKAREAHPTELSQAEWHIERKPLVYDAQLVEFRNQTSYVAHLAVERRGRFRRKPCNRIIQQAVIGDQISPQGEDLRSELINALWTVRGKDATQKTHPSLFFPLAPHQAQMGEIELVRQEGQQLLGMELRKVDAIRRCRIRADEQRQKMLVDFNDKVAEALLFGLCFGIIAVVCNRSGKRTASLGDVDSIVRQAHIREAGRTIRLLEMMPASRSFATEFNWLRLRTW